MLSAEHFKLVVASVMWHHAARVEDTKENSCYSGPREATVSAKDTFSLFDPIFFPLCLQEKLFHLQAFAGALNTTTSNVKPKARFSISSLILHFLYIPDFIQICESSTCTTLIETDPEQFMGEQG